MSYIPQVDTDAMMASANAGMAQIRAGLDEKRALTKEAKLSCDHCKKHETSVSPLQACSRCRSVRYCSRGCQLAHYKMTHKEDCANFASPPLCRAFNTTICLSGCSYPETPIFALGVSQGMGAWVSKAGSIHCRLATLPGGRKNLDRNDPLTMLMMTPGMARGKYLSLRVLVQNRSPKAKPMVVIGTGIVAFASAKGTPIILEGKEPGEPSTMFGPLLGLAQVDAQITYFNGKSLEKKEAKSCPAVKDAAACAVLLNVGEHAIFNVEFRAGGPRITHDFQALELLQHVVVPCIPYDHKASGPYLELLMQAADRNEVCEVRAVLDQVAVDAWYKDYKTKGESAYISGHYGEARARMMGEGNKVLGGDAEGDGEYGRYEYKLKRVQQLRQYSLHPFLVCLRMVQFSAARDSLRTF
ncbi:Ubiquitin carboxyl-terminal hydrolase 18-like protein [Mycena sanguinolenta]|uniref:Ubiquitin carboxyl-terminal hydrolase 18-like protein n=1 Tax=Mycena sanguinolenta TaxID=230812 RepID=A0A8H7DIM4_9AGAR|nr:Ubiquitin carboxyl-terminal hydrolase 18-like protein [Mycena sanguinolenta]